MFKVVVENRRNTALKELSLLLKEFAELFFKKKGLYITMNGDINSLKAKIVS